MNNQYRGIFRMIRSRLRGQHGQHGAAINSIFVPARPSSEPSVISDKLMPSTDVKASFGRQKYATTQSSNCSSDDELESNSRSIFDTCSQRLLDDHLWIEEIERILKMDLCQRSERIKNLFSELHNALLVQYSQDLEEYTRLMTPAASESDLDDNLQPDLVADFKSESGSFDPASEVEHKEFVDSYLERVRPGAPVPRLLEGKSASPSNEPSKARASVNGVFGGRSRSRTDGAITAFQPRQARRSRTP